MENKASLVASIVQRLREQGYRLTPQRAAILRAVVESDAHPTAEEIHRQLSTDFPMLSMATVYKTLHVLRELGVVQELQVDGRTRFDGNTAPHAHLVCVQCHRIVDLTAGVEVRLSKDALEAEGFRMVGYSLEVYGLCSRCRRKSSSAE